MVTARNQQMTFDPFTLEVLWTRAIAIAAEMGATIVRINAVAIDLANGELDGPVTTDLRRARATA